MKAKKPLLVLFRYKGGSVILIVVVGCVVVPALGKWAKFHLMGIVCEFKCPWPEMCRLLVYHARWLV
jgi:hypothetical protein